MTYPVSVVQIDNKQGRGMSTFRHMPEKHGRQFDIVILRFVNPIHSISICSLMHLKIV
jgi:hypothetical protein